MDIKKSYVPTTSLQRCNKKTLNKMTLLSFYRLPYILFKSAENLKTAPKYKASFKEKERKRERGGLRDCKHHEMAPFPSEVSMWDLITVITGAEGSSGDSVFVPQVSMRLRVPHDLVTAQPQVRTVSGCSTM